MYEQRPMYGSLLLTLIMSMLLTNCTFYYYNYVKCTVAELAVCRRKLKYACPLLWIELHQTSYKYLVLVPRILHRVSWLKIVFFCQTFFLLPRSVFTQISPSTWFYASEMTYCVSYGALNSTHTPFTQFTDSGIFFTRRQVRLTNVHFVSSKWICPSCRRRAPSRLHNEVAVTRQYLFQVVLIRVEKLQRKVGKKIRYQMQFRRRQKNWRIDLATQTACHWISVNNNVKDQHDLDYYKRTTLTTRLDNDVVLWTMLSLYMGW